jgi:hypothetical protein
LDFLATASDGATADAAKTGKTVLAVVAAGGDPAGFHGRDLLARLAALYHADTGAFGDGSTFSQSFAILGIQAAGGSLPTAALAELKALQDSDGSWSYGTAPVAAGGGDTNSTAIALMALGLAGDHSADATALAYLRTQQLADGGFPYQNASVWGPPASDPDSDAVVLQALVAAGQDPEGASWQQASNTVLTHLRSGQGADGGFAFPGMSENAFTTSQVPAALMRAPYAAAVHWTAGRSLPAIDCPSPTASPSPSPSASPTASPSPNASASPSPSATPNASASPTAKPTVRPTAKPTVRPTARPTARPTVRPTASPTDSIATTEPTEPTQTPTDEPTWTATEGPDLTAEVAGAASAAGGPSGPTDSSTTPLFYGAAAVLGLIVVLGGGWALMARPGKR